MEERKKEIDIERFFVSVITKQAKEQGIETAWSSGNWICKLSKGSKHCFIYGYNFPLNNMTSSEMVLDKTATSQHLLKNDISCVEHTLFMKPELSHFVSKNSTQENISKFLATYNFPLVCKDNRGKGGHNVYKANNENELNEALKSVWGKARGAAICPFYDIESEYRFFVLDNKIEFVYKKIKSEDSWKFNLSKGGSAELCNIDHFPSKIIKNVLKATVELDLRICSVDIIKIKNTNEYLILEINTGISTEYFSQTSKEAKELSENLYSQILRKIFE